MEGLLLLLFLYSLEVVFPFPVRVRLGHYDSFVIFSATSTLPLAISSYTIARALFIAYFSL